MKKTYIIPSVEVVNIEAVEMLATSSVRVLSDESGDEQMSGERRGTWGNRWTD